jgi:methyl-accepting chemotaxis protein
MPIQVPVVQTGLEKSIQQAATKVGKNMRINMGPGAKSIESLSRPLGRLTGKADEFTKSMEAANARVLAFGASVGVIAAVSNSLKQLVTVTIQVEKSLANINSILKQSESQLESFKSTIFDVARNTEQTFDTVAEAALELSRQGLKAEEVTKRLNDALILSRLSGLSAADSVAGLTACHQLFLKCGYYKR